MFVCTSTLRSANALQTQEPISGRGCLLDEPTSQLEARIYILTFTTHLPISVCVRKIFVIPSFFQLHQDTPVGQTSSSGVMSGEGSGAGADLVPDPELFIHYTRSTDEPFITADYGGGRQPITQHVYCTIQACRLTFRPNGIIFWFSYTSFALPTHIIYILAILGQLMLFSYSVWWLVA